MARGRRQAGAAAFGALAWPAALALLAAAPASGQTRAGIAITNVATLHQDGSSVASNAVTLTVAERLDVALARAPQADRPGTVAVELTNRGNGAEAFAVAAAVTAGSATLTAPSTAGNDGEPVPLTDGRTPPLAPGASITLLVPVSAADAAVLTVSARAATGRGEPGTLFPGAGDGGGDAVVGATGAAASIAVPLTADSAPTLAKTQMVVAPDGSAAAVPGARITYALEARFAAAAASAEIDDRLPAGTTYLPGSITLDNGPLADAGHVAGGQVSVPLGAVAAGTVRTLRFTVVIS